MTENYYRVRLSFVNKAVEPELTLFCFEHGALGLSEALNFTQPDLTYEPSLINRRFLELDVFFTARPGDEFYQTISEKFHEIKVTNYEEQSKDWLEEWKKGFVPFKLVGSAWVVPSWLEKPPEAKIEIKIDPGMAFGTGTHATTKMASYFIHKLSVEYPEAIGQWSVIDVGTGTAILAVLAEKLGFGLITGVEIDPEARRKARENCEMNESQQVLITDLQIDEIKEQFDVVVANIIDGVLIRIQKDLLRVMKPSGHLFLTGILQERDNLFFDKFIEANQLKVIKRIQKDEWVGYWVQKQ